MEKELTTKHMFKQPPYQTPIHAPNPTPAPKRNLNLVHTFPFPHIELVDLLQIINAANAAQVVAPNAIYKLVRSGASSVFGNAVLGFVAASASATNSSLILCHVTLTCSGADIFSAAVYASGCSSLLCVVLSQSALSAVYIAGSSSSCGYRLRNSTM